jgi:hypothetical protein
MKEWICTKCNHLIISKEKPELAKWTDGHVCHFVEIEGKQMNKEKLENMKSNMHHEFNHFIARPSKKRIDLLTKMMHTFHNLNLNND